MCAKINSQKKIDKNFQEVIKILNKEKIKYWICHGSLLGIIRDNELIPWDHDIDIAVWKSKKIKKKIRNIMKENNYLFKKKFFVDDGLYTFTKKGGREIDFNFYEKNKIKLNGLAFVFWYVPRNIFFKFIDAISKNSPYSGKYSSIINSLKVFKPIFKLLRDFFILIKIFYKKTGYTMPLKYFKKFKKIKFQGLQVIVPKEPIKCLKFTYGVDWNKKIKNFNWIKDSPSTKSYN